MEEITTDDLRYLITHNEAAGQWEVNLPAGDTIGYLSYEYLDDSIIFTHTSLRSEYRGRGIAEELVRAALRAEKERGEYKVVPACSFVRKFCAENPELV